MTTAAIIIGGSNRVWRDLETALQLCVDADADPEFYVTNDMLPLIHDDVIACTLHPSKLEWWLGRRQANNLPSVKEMWTHEQSSRAAPTGTHLLTDWGGSSGLFAFQVARSHGHVRMILCGVPMSTDRHFERKKQWRECAIFLPAWERHLPEIVPFARSVSGGWTEEKLGRATVEWVKS